MMKSVPCKALLLLLLAKLALTGHPEGSHSLRYLQTFLAEPSNQDYQFICSVYMDDVHVERFSSIEDIPKLEHCAPWVNQHEPEYWERETQGMLGLMNLYDDIYNRFFFYTTNRTGFHTIQALLACYVQPGGIFSHGQYELFFRDGDEFIVLNEDLKTWTAVGEATEFLRQEWDQSGFAKHVKTFLERDCVRVLLQKLMHGEIYFLRKDAPQIHITHKSIADQKITLRCWAMSFYPAEISLTWKKDENNQTLDMEVIETRPSGDGTFQKWAAVVVPSGEEQKYTCHVNHEGLPEPMTVKWEPPQPSVPTIPIVIGLVLGALLMGAVVTFLIWKRRIKAG